LMTLQRYCSYFDYEIASLWHSDYHMFGIFL